MRSQSYRPFLSAVSGTEFFAGHKNVTAVTTVNTASMTTCSFEHSAYFEIVQGGI